MNPAISTLQPYPFQKLAALHQGITPPADRDRILLSLGEPKHAPPAFVLEGLKNSLPHLSRYPVTRGEYDLREAIASWLHSRYALQQKPDPETQVLPVAGSREALFSFAQAVIDRTVPNPVVVMPNPFYQIYEGAALLAGATPYFANTTSATNYKIDLDAVPVSVWQQAQLVYVCSPGNPTGAVMTESELGRLIDLAQQYDFVIASDECYSEIYFNEAAPPPGLLQVAEQKGLHDYDRCVVFHSLSKRSNLPGLRSGFVAGDAAILGEYLQYRTYHGCALPLPTQDASVLAWQDEDHVRQNRERYREKFAAVLDILSPVLNTTWPDAGFYLWPHTPIDDETFALDLFAQENVVVLPGSYLSRETRAGNPGRNHVRMALVATLDECVEAAMRIRRYMENIGS